MDIIKENKSNSSKSKPLKRDIDFQYSSSVGTDMKHHKNLAESFNELKTHTVKTRKCYSAFKLSTYFMGDREFTNIFGTLLTEVEHALNKMTDIFQMVPGYSIDSVKKELFKKADNSEVSTVPNGAYIHSLTPPPSEVGNEQNSVSSSRKRKKKRNESGRAGSTSVPKKSKKIAEDDEVIKINGNNLSVDNSSVPKNSKKVVEDDVKIHSNNLSVDNSDCIGDRMRARAPVKYSDKEETNVSATEIEVAKVGEPEEYEVETIKDFVRKQGKEFFHVSWKGYKSDDDTFEPVEHLFGCDLIMEDFFLKRIEQRNVCQSYEEFKTLQFPMDSSVKEVLFNSFKKFLKPVDVKEVLRYSMSCKLFTKTKEELAELLNKVTSYREPSLEKYARMFHNLKMQFSMFAMQPERQRQLALLRTWERNINMICSDPAPITVENNADLALPPLGFIYINDQKAGPNINISKDPMIGCSCTDCNAGQNSCCPKGMESFYAYTKYGRLKVSLGTPIYECNKVCACSQDCPNRVVQKGRRIPMTIFRTDNGRGWGVRAQETIRKDTFVTEYVGEVITSEEAEKRGMKYDAKGCTYLFDLDYNKGDLNPYTIDAAKYGNVSHFINHSCDPSLVVFNVWVNCLDPDLPRLALFANRDVKKGEELTFDYNSGSTKQQFEAIIRETEGDDITTPKKGETTPESNGDRIHSPLSARKNRREGTTKCLCGAANCRQYFF